jgi:hypothetical protein
MPKKGIKKMTIYKKYQQLQQAHIEQHEGAIFYPEMATEFYDVDFTELEFGKDFETSLGAILTANGAEPKLHINFTDKGIKKLLNSNVEMINMVERLYQEYKEDGLL